jgi:hypothetical protein
MKKLLIGLAFFAFGATAQAQTTVCVDFDNFCDGLEYTISGGIDGTWQTYDCAGSDARLDATIPQGGGSFLSICSAGSCDVADFAGFDTFLWILDIPGQTGTLVGILGGVVTPFQINTPISTSPGACAFGPETNRGPSFPIGQ